MLGRNTPASKRGHAGVSEFAAILPSKMGAILAIGGSLPTVVQKADGRYATL